MNIAIHFLMLMVGIATLCFGCVEFVLLALFSTVPWYAVYNVVGMYLSVWFSMRQANHLKAIINR